METKVGSDQSTSQQVTAVVIDQVANQENVDQLALPPLHNEIDTDALNTLFTGSQTTAIQVTFRYNGYEITVAGQDQVQVTSMSDAGD